MSSEGSASRRDSTISRAARSPSHSTRSSRSRVVGTSEHDASSAAASPRHPPSSPYRGISEIDLSSPMNYGTPSSVGSTRSGRSGNRGTPFRLRPDIGSSHRRFREINVASEGAQDERQSQVSESDDGVNFLIWGTDVSANKCRLKFRRFIEEFIDATPTEEEISTEVDRSLPYYMQKLEEVKLLEDPFLNLNCAHLEAFDEDLYKQLISFPEGVLPAFDIGVNEVFFAKYPGFILDHKIQVRPFNSRKLRNMRQLNPEDIDQLITINGMVIRTSQIIPEIREAWFRCTVCLFELEVEIDKGRIAEPTLCTSCSTNYCFQLIHNRSKFTDKQIVKLQEAPDDIPAGQTPQTVMLMSHNDLVDAVQAGERVTITGVFRATAIQVNPLVTSVRSIYRTYIDVVHYQKIDERRLYASEDGKLHQFTPERIEILKQLSTRDDIYDRLARALAPSIHENDDIKKGILLQLFGGTKKASLHTGRGNFRSEVNILLCGDPGTSKSQLLTYVYNLVPRSQYTSGKGSSAVGLTAYVTKDPETRQLVLQTGALVLADNGICCIDEFDKMDDSTRSVLHEVMEQQTLSIAKAGIICQLNARTSILAAANPLESQWNPNKTVIENVKLPHTLLSRFDLIFLLMDPQDERYDKRLAWHLVSLYHKRREYEEEEHVDLPILRDYIAYARDNIHPRLSDEASHKLVQSYVDMRKVGSGRGQISAYPRQLESLIRLSEAHAKMRFSDVVQAEDVDEAWRLHREAIKQTATDPLTGKVDISIITTGVSESARQKRRTIVQLLLKMLKEMDKSTTLEYQKLFNDAKQAFQAPITREMFDDALRDLKDERVISIVGRMIKIL